MQKIFPIQSACVSWILFNSFCPSSDRQRIKMFYFVLCATEIKGNVTQLDYALYIGYIYIYIYKW